jgi:hypothetical protein
MTVADAVDRLSDRVSSMSNNYYMHKKLEPLEFDLSLIEKDLEFLKTLIKITRRQEGEVR